MLDFSYFFFFSIESRSMKHFQPRDFGRNYEKPEVFRITIFLNGENVMIFFINYNGQVTESSTLFRITWRRFCLLHTASTRPRSGSSWRTPTETAWCPGTSCSRSPWTSAWPPNRPQKPWICSIWLGTSTATGN